MIVVRYDLQYGVQLSALRRSLQLCALSQETRASTCWVSSPVLFPKTAHIYVSASKFNYVAGQASVREILKENPQASVKIYYALSIMRFTDFD